MASPWSTSTVLSDRALRRRVHDAYERLLAGGSEPDAGVRAIVRESWTRSLRSHATPEGLPRLDLATAELEAYRAAHPLAPAREMIRGLLLPGDADSSGVIVAIGDAAGRLLWVEGDRAIRDATGAMGFVPGADWSEASVGTSAPGTALAVGDSVQIDRAEHFNRSVQSWSCTAAPVRDPETGRIVGVIDVTGGDHAVTAQAQLLVSATARAVEGELLRVRLQARTSAPPARTARRMPVSSRTRATLQVLGRDLALLEVEVDGTASTTELSLRHAEILLLLARHRQGLSAERLAELVYGDAAAVATVRPEMVRLRRMLEKRAPALVPESRPYRLTGDVDTDAHQVLSLLDRGAHRVALAAYPGDVLPESTAPGVEEFRDTVRGALREAIMSEAALDVLLAFADTDAGASDVELLRQCLRLLPARSPKRAGLVARLEALAP